MSRVKFSALVSDISGSIGDTTFGRWKGQPYVRGKTKPSNPNTDAQKEVRDAMKATVAAWKEIRTSLKDAYDAGAGPLNISGYNDFTKQNVNSIKDDMGLFGPRRGPDYKESDFALPEDVDATEGSNSGEVELTWTDPGGGSDDYVAIIVIDDDTKELVYQDLEAAEVSEESAVIEDLEPGNLQLMAVIAHNADEEAFMHAEAITSSAAE